MTQSIQSRLLVAIAAAVAVLALLAPAASALTEPKEGYKQFAGCPDATEAPTIKLCSRALITGGHFQMGSKDVPIENTIELSGGYNTAGTEFAASPKGGMTKVQQKVPGGVVGLTGLTWLLEFFGNESLTLYAVTEPAGFPGAPLSDPLKLPIKVHLINPGGLLGENCYVGSFTEPINLNLTVGTTSPPEPNKPITGTPPTLETGGAPGIIKGSNAVYVDNSFAAPGANGCQLVLFGFIPISINGLVNSASGLPAAAGTNETKQNVTAEIVTRKFVY